MLQRFTAPMANHCRVEYWLYGGIAAAVLFGGAVMAVRLRRAAERAEAVTAAPLRQPDQESQIGPYRVVGPLGQGRQSDVWRAEANGQMVTLKLLRSELQEDREAVDRFRREIRVVMLLQHPNIARMLDSGQDDGIMYMAVELVEGRSLAEIIPEGGMPPEAALAILEQLLPAVYYAHQQQIVHRDLKPENVMVTPEGVVKVLDFGFARSPRHQRVTGVGASMGTPTYMAPEQMSQNDGIDVRSDQYALGCLVYEMLCGRPPFMAVDLMHLLIMHMQSPVPDLARDEPWAAAVSAVVRRMMAKAPGDRYSDLMEALQAIRGALSGR